ncbi:MAG: SH3 domain-containing protein [Chloroflexi bacterium]|nr:SH3 domain-containing protein [Chloroflexota bacterium]
MKRIALLLIAVLVFQMLPASTIEASPDNTLIGLSWHAEYFANQYLVAPATLVREEGALNYNWGANRPVEIDNFPADYFSVRWTTRPTLDAGNYRFSVTADDSVKLTVDYTSVVIDTMNAPQAGQKLTADFTLSAGSHYFQIDYRELAGNASITATLEKLDGQQQPNPDGSVSPLPSSPSAYVTAYSLRYRSGPGLNYTILGTQPKNTIVQLIGRNGDATWAKVILPSGTQAWMSTSYLSANVDFWSLPVVTDEGVTNPDGAESGLMTGIVTAYALNVRSGPSTSYAIIGRLVLFTPVQIIGRNDAGTWLRIRRSSGTLGWVSATYVRVDANIMSLPIVY